MRYPPLKAIGASLILYSFIYILFINYALVKKKPIDPTFEKVINKPLIPIQKNMNKNMPETPKSCYMNRTKPQDFDHSPILLAGPKYAWIYGSGRYNHIPCDVNCIVTRDWNENIFYRADGLLFYQQNVLPKVCDHQKTFYFTMENSFDFELKDYDYSLFTLSNTDIYASYFNYGYNLLLKPIEKTKKSVASSYITNCKYHVTSNRNDLIRELLAEGISIDLFGNCFGDLNIPEPNQEIGNKEERKLKNMAQYKFNLVFENSIKEGYISEKYWQALAAGTVPIVLGAPDIRKYEPRPGSIINVHDFKDTRELANEIKRLVNDTEAYNKMLEWKTIGFSDEFLAVTQYTAPMYECRVCLKVADTIIDQTHFEAILVRELNTYYYYPVYLYQFTLKEIKEEIQKVFREYIPIWHEKRKERDIREPLRIHRIVLSGQKYEDIFWGDHIDSDFKVMELKAGSKLDVIFV